MPHLDAMEKEITPEAKVVYSPLNRRGNPFIKATVKGVTPHKVKIERDDYPGYLHTVEPKRLMVLP